MLFFIHAPYSKEEESMKNMQQTLYRFVLIASALAILLIAGQASMDSGMDLQTGIEAIGFNILK